MALRMRFPASPSLRFLALGVALFGLWELRARPAPIEVSPALALALAAERAAEVGHPLTAEERAAVVEQWVDEEVLFREALARGLHRSDPIVRRRLVQAMRFVLDDEGAEPSAEELERFAAAHPERFSVPARVSFEHVFLGAGPAAPAQRALDQGAPFDTLGLPFATGPRFDAQPEEAVTGAFGAAFAARVFALAPGAWAELQSPYGRHLVRVTHRTPEQLPPLPKIAGPVRAALRDERRGAASAQQLAALRKGYSVEGLPR